ncbi:MAG: hypothetical protein ACOYCA_05840 [Eggerthellaceae bacterium]|jgi:hypothetical protein
MVNDTQARVATEAMLPTKKELRQRQNPLFQLVRFIRLGFKMWVLDVKG